MQFTAAQHGLFMFAIYSRGRRDRTIVVTIRCMSTDYRTLVQTQIASTGFVEAVFKGQRRGDPPIWREVTIRPIQIKDQRQLQFSYFDAQQNIVKNFAVGELAEPLDALLDQAFKSIVLKFEDGDIAVQFTKKGRAIVHRHRKTEAPRVVDLSHDRSKDRPLTDDQSAEFLKAVGIMTAEGKIRPKLYSKYKQINEFVRLLAESDALDQWGDAPLNVVDLGCGSAYLTFAAYHYLRDVRGLNATLTGVDLKSDLMARHAAKLDALGWHEMQFVNARIIDYKPDTPPDVVIALHACDTATDEALAQGIGWGSKLILAAPCCHHNLQAQLAQNEVVAPFWPIQRHGILQEELGTILTDAFRALILRIMGYRTEVIEFVSAEHTPKNNLIRAVKTTAPGDPQFVREYEALKQFWGVIPYLETVGALHDL